MIEICKICHQPSTPWQRYQDGWICDSCAYKEADKEVEKEEISNRAFKTAK